MHAALELAAELDDPEAMIVTILPDGGRSYLSKVFNDAWMSEHGFLSRGGAATVGDVLQRKHGLGEVPPLVTVGAHQLVRDAVALLHEHRVSQLPVVSASDPRVIVGSVAERGLLKHAVEDAGLLDAEVARVMEAPLPAVSTSDPIADAVSALVGDRQALMVLDGGVPVGVVTRGDVLEAVAS
jgi:cystathionine beta-synthase